MVEVFKTNVSNRETANRLIAEIQNRYTNYQATFDLDDCDRILRIACSASEVHPHHLIDLLSTRGYHAEILEDILPDGSVHTNH